MTDVLHLYSSNIRELYALDILGVLACPKQAEYRFRYQARHVPDTTRAQWTTMGGKNPVHVRVHFSMQSPSNYHRAVYIPVRMGHVKHAFIEGGILVVDFVLGDYVAIAEPTAADKLASEETPDKAWGAAIRRYNDEFRQIVGGNHPDEGVSAAIAASTDDLLEKLPSQASRFERTIDYLSRVSTFENTVFWRIVDVTDPAGTQVTMANGAYSMETGSRYRISVSHYERVQSPAGASLELKLSDNLEPLDSTSYAIGGSYDVATFEVGTSATDAVQLGMFNVSVQGAKGASRDFSYEASPPTVKTAVTAGGTVLGLFLVAVPSLIGDDYTPAKIFIALLGAGITAATLVYRLRFGLPGT